MGCARCAEERARGLEFCGACGERLAVACPACRALNPPAHKFCSECGASLRGPAGRFDSPQTYTPKHLADRILTSRSALEGERKQVTIVFADIKGSLEMLAGKDPEEARKILDPVLEQMMEAVHRFEGTVNQVMGDGIMAIFGAPLAHEDHAVRACYAALRIRDQIAAYADGIRRDEGISVQVRIGINSGEVVVRSIGSDLHMDYTAVGQTTHLAARMEQIAVPGSILMTADTLRLADGYVQVRPIGPVRVRGVADSVDVYEITGAGPVRSRFQAAAARGLTPFVGRRAEIIVLQEALALARTGRGQIAAVVGEPGVGKSRLLHEFVHSRHTAECLVLESNSVSYGRATPYLPIIELLKNYFKIHAHDTQRAIREKATGKLLTLDTSLQDAIAPVLDLLDALPEDHEFRSVDPLQHRHATYQAILRLLLKESRLVPVVLVFEDLHWNDSLTLGFLNELIGQISSANVLLLVSYRPEHQDEWAKLPNYRRVRLHPLAAENLAELLDGLVGRDPALAQLKMTLLERTGGNPLFIEELVRTLADTAVIRGTRGNYRLIKDFSSVQVPPTVQAVLAARIDRLPSEEKRILQEAAVIGLDVPFVLLHTITSMPEDELRARLGNLQAAEFLYVTQLFPDLQYTFKHSLTHEVAYTGLLHERRRNIHASIVEAIERLFADRLGEYTERLAHHAFRGHLPEKAVSYLRLAGEKAADRQAYREALALFEQALVSLGELPDTRERLEQSIDLRFAIRNVLQPLGERTRIAECLRECEHIAKRLGDAARMGWVQSYLTEHHWMLGRYRDAIAAGEQALEIATRVSDLAMRVVTNLPLGLAYHTAGDYARALEYFRWNAAQLEGGLRAQRFGMFVLPSSFSLSFVAWCHAEVGNFAEGWNAGHEALQIAEAERHPFSCGYAHWGLGLLALRQGDLQHAIRSFECALSEAGFAESPVGFAYVAFHLGYALSLAGRPEDGTQLLEQTVAMAESRNFAARHSLRLAYLAESYLISGRKAEANATVVRALQLAVDYQERANEAYALRVLGEVQAQSEAAADADASYRQSLALADELGMKPLAAHCLLSLAERAAAQGRTLEAAQQGEGAQALFRAMDARPWTHRLVRSQTRA